MKEIYQVKTRPIALSENQVVGKKYRITILTDCLIRFEYNEQGEFEDRATQTVFYRDFPKVEYRVVEKEEGLEIHTANLHVIYNEKEFTSYGLKIQVKGNLSAYHSVWRYGEGVHDLGGTARTLDMVDGETSLERGIVSYFGYSVLDDSHSQILLDNGLVVCLLGVQEIPAYHEQAVEFLKSKFKNHKVFLKYDTVKYNDNDELMCYMYLDNKTFINNHLIRTGYVAVDERFDYSCKGKFLKSYPA